MQESEIFQIARRLSSAEQDVYLNKKCEGNPALRQELEELLQAHQRYAVVPQASVETLTPVPDTLFTSGHLFEGKYRIDRLLGEGGMGTVFLADQREPVQRRVAIKVIRGQIVSPSILARFELEQRSLALMDHPCIAKVHDAGISAKRSPYFVMEYIQGESLTSYFRSVDLPLRSRLQIMIQVCQAMHHAHQKGIIHRDLKPSNILVGLVDGKPQPRIIDFGTVKMLEGKLTDNSIQTEFGALVGTPEYMSPEQSAFGTDIDTRSDIYSLGIILYEILTGTVPFPRTAFEKTGLSAMLRAIRESEPVKPSVAIMRSDSRSGAHSTYRSSIIRGDLDCIVMKALEKDRERRYSSAEALAEDLMRYLADEPVLARPASASYRLKKFVRKNRGTVIAASLILLTLLTGLTGTSWAMFRAESHAKSAKNAETVAKNRLADLELEKKKTDEAIEISNSLVDFFLIDVFRQADPKGQKSRREPVVANLSLKDALLNAAKAIEGRFADKPYHHAILRRNIGKTLVSVGEHRQALVHFKKAVELLEPLADADPVQLLLARSELGDVLVRNGNYREALAILPGVLQEEERLIGEDEKQTLDTLHRLAAACTSLQQFPVAKEHWEKLIARRSRKLGPDHESTIESRTELAFVIARLGNLSTAISTLEADHQTALKALDEDHHVLLHNSRILALCYNAAGQQAKAVPMYEKLEKLFTRQYGKDHPETLINHIHRGRCLSTNQQHQEAIKVLDAALPTVQTKFGTMHGYTLMCLHHLGSAYLADEQVEQARPLLEKAYQLRVEVSGKDNLDTVTILPELAQIHQRLRKPDQSIPYLEMYHQYWQGKEGAASWNTRKSLILLATAHQYSGQVEKAKTLLQPLADEVLKCFQATDKNQLLVVNSFLRNLERLGTPQQAEPMRRIIVKEFSNDKKQSNYQLSLSQLAHNLNQQKKYAEAEPLILECLQIQASISKEDVWEIARLQTIHAASLLGLKQYEKAEKLLKQAYPRLKENRPKTIHPLMSLEIQLEATQHFAELYRALGKPEEQKHWEAEAQTPLPKQ